MAMLSVTVPDRVLATLEREARLCEKSLDEVVMAYLADIPAQDLQPTKPSHDLWRKETADWLKDRPIRNIVIDDDRETIYGGPDGRGIW